MGLERFSDSSRFTERVRDRAEMETQRPGLQRCAINLSP